MSGIEPRETPTHAFYMQLAGGKIPHVNVSYFQFTAPRWFYGDGMADNVIVKKIQPRNAPV